MTEEIKGTIKKVEGVAHELRREIRKEVQETNKQQSNFQDSITQSIQEHRKQQEKRVQEVKESVGEVKKKQDEMEIRVREVADNGEKTTEVMRSKVDQIQEGQKRLQLRMENAEERRIPHGTELPQKEQLTFNGEGSHPMEFLSELEELQQAYYENNSTKWISQHLTDEAATWWRLTKPTVNNFQEFKEVFIQKYWDELRQERIRNELEYGRYEWYRHRSMSRYMEEKLLEVRHLTPTIPIMQVIRKLSKHFGREVQLATLTRGVRSIAEFGLLLNEYQTLMGGHPHDQQMEAKPHDNVETNVPHYKQQWRHNGPGYKGKHEGDRNFHKHKQPDTRVNNLEVVNCQPSTSKETIVNASQQQNKYTPANGNRQ